MTDEVIHMNDIAVFLPEAEVDNGHFCRLTGRDADWFVARTGIHTRRRAGPQENASSMGIESVHRLVEKRPDALDGVDLIIGASYTPDDTLSTLPFRVQRAFGIAAARTYFVSTACSSFISVLEIARLMLRAGEARKALLVTAEHNSRYSDDADQFSGHLWGDGAAAVIVSRDPAGALFSVDYARSSGVACEGKGPDAINLDPALGRRGLVMREGRDVFTRACEHLAAEVLRATDRLGVPVQDVDWLVPHQANLRILTNVAGKLGLPMERCVVTVDRLGNTGCASIPISLEYGLPQMRAGHLVALTAFGGGYSSGAAILRRC